MCSKTKVEDECLCVYLCVYVCQQGIPGVFKGLSDLAREETTRNPNLQEPLKQALDAAADLKRKRQMEGKGDVSDCSIIPLFCVCAVQECMQGPMRACPTCLNKTNT